MWFSLRCRAALSGAALLFLAGCFSSGLDGRQYVRQEIAQGDFIDVSVGSGAHRIQALLRKTSAANTLTVYLEGDGAAWLTPWRPPVDPTPDQPVALALARADPSPAVAYLARPCQYLDETSLAQCVPTAWTTRRFAPEATAAMNAALSRLKAVAGAEHLRLVGYSGGGVMAALLAAQRRDVSSLITIAAPLRLAAWTAHHDVTALIGQDPDDLPAPWPPAVHFVGEKDEIVPPAIVAPLAKRTDGRLYVVPGFDHRCCWSRDWRHLLEKTR